MTRHSLLVAAAVLAGAPGLAGAATVKFAVGFADNSGGTYHLRTDYSYNSLAAPNSFSRFGVGDYQFVFGKVGSASVGGNVQARGYGDNVRCSVLSWTVATGSSDVTVRVACAKPGGTAPDTSIPADTWVAVQFYAASGADSLETAYLRADLPAAPTYTPAALYSYNSSGGVNVVAHGTGPGDYLAYLPGLAAAGGNPHVTAVASAARYCKLASWYHALGGVFAVVHCFDVEGDPADAQWALRYTNGHLADVGAHRGTYFLGDVNFAPAVPGPHSYAPALAWHSGGLVYSVLDDNAQAVATIPGMAIGAPMSPMVTAIGADNTYCNPIGMTTADGVHVLGYVRCYDAAGNLVGSPFTYALWTR